MPIQTFKRYEKKFIITLRQKEQLLSALKPYMQYDSYCVGNKDYSVYNVYFDTHNNDVVRRSNQKPYYKEKLRLRSYTVNPSDDTSVFLEIKKKIGGIVNKRRIVIPYHEAAELIQNGTPPKLDGIQAQILNEILYYIQNHPIESAVFLRYDRTALFGRDDHNLRITFDGNLKAHPTSSLLHTSNDGEWILPPENQIMEIKIPGAFPVWLAALLSEHKIYSSGFSKFGQNYINHLENNPSKLLPYDKFVQNF